MKGASSRNVEVLAGGVRRDDPVLIWGYGIPGVTCCHHADVVIGDGDSHPNIRRRRYLPANPI